MRTIQIGMCSILAVLGLTGTSAAQPVPQRQAPAAMQAKPAPARPPVSRSTASLAETLGWVKDQLVSNPRNGSDFTPISFTSCTLKWRYGSPSRGGTTTLPLATVDPSRLKVEADGYGWSLWIVTMKDQKSITEEHVGVLTATDILSYTNLAFASQDIADRTQRAIQHAVELCAKQQPF